MVKSKNKTRTKHLFLLLLTERTKKKGVIEIISRMVCVCAYLHSGHILKGKKAALDKRRTLKTEDGSLDLATRQPLESSCSKVKT